MHQILAEFLDKWVWPTAPGAPGAEFRLRITEEKCIKGWEMAVAATLSEIEKGLASGNEDWKRRIAMGGYAAEGVQMSIKQMSAQLVSVDIAEQERYAGPAGVGRVQTQQIARRSADGEGLDQKRARPPG